MLLQHTGILRSNEDSELHHVQRPTWSHWVGRGGGGGGSCSIRELEMMSFIEAQRG